MWTGSFPATNEYPVRLSCDIDVCMCISMCLCNRIIAHLAHVYLMRILLVNCIPLRQRTVFSQFHTSGHTSGSMMQAMFHTLKAGRKFETNGGAL